MRRTSPLAVVASVLLLAACQATAQVAGPSASASAVSTAVSAVPTIVAASAAPSEGPLSSAAAAFQPESVAKVVVDGLRMRSLPSVDATSRKLEPLLPNGALLYVVEGPVSGSGYAWYRVLPIAFDGSATVDGWVAVASRDAEPWITLAAVDCPLPPTTRDAVRALSRGAALACFGGVPLTFEARIVSCRCEMDGPGLEPGWFGIEFATDASGTVTTPLLVDRGQTQPGPIPSWFIAHLDPTADIPDPIPFDRDVRIIGQFDHPAAGACRYAASEQSATASPVLDCRTTFAITAVQPIR